MIPVVDLFAGPGGLGEGFSAFNAPERVFKIYVSIEKDEAEKKEKPVKLAKKKEHIPPSLENDIANEPIIQSVIEIFDGEVL